MDEMVGGGEPDGEQTLGPEMFELNEAAAMAMTKHTDDRVDGDDVDSPAVGPPWGREPERGMGRGNGGETRIAVETTD